MKPKMGPAAVTTWTAHKIAIIFYTLAKKQVEFDISLWAKRDAARGKRREARLHKQAAQRGYKPCHCGKHLSQNPLNYKYQR